MNLLSVKVAGLDAAFKRLDGRTIGPAVAKAVTVGAERMMTRAKELTPVEFGTLRSSGTVHGVQRAGNVSSVTLSFGGPAAPYAFIVHERLDVHHPVGQAKFLEKAVTDLLPEVGRDIEKVIAERFGGS